MGRLATRADFEGLAHGRPTTIRAGDGALDLVQPTWLYDEYKRFPFFATRAAWIRDAYPRARTVLVAGCAFGFLVEALGVRGIDAWGFDASAYAVAGALDHLPVGAASRVLLADAGARDAVERLMPLTGVHRFDVVVTEDLLPCADDEAEARTWLANLRAVGTEILHICTPTSDASVDNGLLWKTHAEWAAFCAPDPVLCTECWGVARAGARR